MSSYHRHSNISPPASEAPPELQEEELKALLLLWQENRASHQLRVQVLQLSGFVSLSIRKLHWTLSWDFPLQHETTEIWRYFHFDCEIVPSNRNSFFVVVENFPKTEKKTDNFKSETFFSFFSDVATTSVPPTATQKPMTAPMTTRQLVGVCCRRPTPSSVPQSCPRSEPAHPCCYGGPCGRVKERPRENCKPFKTKNIITFITNVCFFSSP